MGGSENYDVIPTCYDIINTLCVGIFGTQVSSCYACEVMKGGEGGRCLCGATPGDENEPDQIGLILVHAFVPQ